MENKFLNVDFNIKNINEKGVFWGYASVYGGKEDSYGDVIAHGAFKESLEEGGARKTGIPMLWQHNHDEPIGKFNSLIETNEGLEVEGKLTLGVQKADEAYLLLKDGVINGMSIGWGLRGGKITNENVEYKELNGKKLRVLKNIDLWEISPVTFPAQTRAKITGTKTIELAKSERELEHALRELGLTRSQSTYIASICKKGMGFAENNKEVKSILNTLNKTGDELSSFFKNN